MDDKVRRAHTESLFRDVNERIAASAERFEADSTQFVCECADPNCTHRVEATLNEYEEVRADGATFMLTPGHAHHDIERVLRIATHRGNAAPLFVKLGMHALDRVRELVGSGHGDLGKLGADTRLGVVTDAAHGERGPETALHEAALRVA